MTSWYYIVWKLCLKSWSPLEIMRLCWGDPCTSHNPSLVVSSRFVMKIFVLRKESCTLESVILNGAKQRTCKHVNNRLNSYYCMRVWYYHAVPSASWFFFSFSILYLSWPKLFRFTVSPKELYVFMFGTSFSPFIWIRAFSLQITYTPCVKLLTLAYLQHEG